MSLILGIDIGTSSVKVSLTTSHSRVTFSKELTKIPSKDQQKVGGGGGGAAGAASTPSTTTSSLTKSQPTLPKITGSITALLPPSTPSRPQLLFSSHLPYKQIAKEIRCSAIRSTVNAERTAEVCPALIFAAVQRCLSTCPAHLMKDVSAIGFCGQMHSCVYWTSNECRSAGPFFLYDSATESYFWTNSSRYSPLFTWEDKRCDSQFLLDQLPAEDLRPYSSIHSGFGCATTFWLNQHDPQYLTQFDCMSSIMDMVTWIICDLKRPFISDQLASSFGYFDMFKCDWNWSLLRKQDNNFPTRLLPTIKKAGSQVGKLKQNWFGIRAGTPVLIPLGDTQCAFYSVLGNSTKGAGGTAVLNCGTSMQLGTVVSLETAQLYQKHQNVFWSLKYERLLSSLGNQELLRKKRRQKVKLARQQRTKRNGSESSESSLESSRSFKSWLMEEEEEAETEKEEKKAEEKKDELKDQQPKKNQLILGKENKQSISDNRKAIAKLEKEETRKQPQPSTSGMKKEKKPQIADVDIAKSIVKNDISIPTLKEITPSLKLGKLSNVPTMKLSETSLKALQKIITSISTRKPKSAIGTAFKSAKLSQKFSCKYKFICRSSSSHTDPLPQAVEMRRQALNNPRIRLRLRRLIIEKHYEYVCFFPFFENKCLAVAASLNGGNVLASFVRCLRKQVEMITGEPIDENLIWKRLFEQWSDKLIGQEEDDDHQRSRAQTTTTSKAIVTNMMINPLLNGERHAQGQALALFNVNKDNFSLPLLFERLCQSLIINVFRMLPVYLLKRFQVSHVIAVGNTLNRNPIMIDFLNRRLQEQQLSVLLEEMCDADFGVAMLTAKFIKNKC